MTRPVPAIAPSRRGRLLQLIALVSTLDRFAMPPMILTMARDLGLPLATVAQAAGTYFLAYGLMQPVWGLIGARIGVVRLLRWTSLAAALTTTATALSTGAVSLTLSRLLAGASYGAAIPAALYYVGSTAAPTLRHREVTRLMTGVALGTAVSTAGAGLLAAGLGWRYAFLVTGGATVLLWLALPGLPELTTREDTGLLLPLLEVWRSTPARILLVLAAAEGAVLLGALTFLPAAAASSGSPTSVAAGTTAVYGVAVLVFAPVVGRLTYRVGAARLIAAGATCAVLGCTIAAASVRPPAVVVVATLLGLSWAAMHSTLQTWATEVVPRAGFTAVSLFAGALFAGSSAAATLGGALADRGRFSLIFAAGAAMALPLGVFGVLSRLRWEHAKEPA
jgi:predicted MFS family arabinose efflux permease